MNGVKHQMSQKINKCINIFQFFWFGELITSDIVLCFKKTHRAQCFKVYVVNIYYNIIFLKYSLNIINRWVTIININENFGTISIVDIFFVTFVK